MNCAFNRLTRVSALCTRWMNEWIIMALSDRANAYWITINFAFKRTMTILNGLAEKRVTFKRSRYIPLSCALVSFVYTVYFFLSFCATPLNSAFFIMCIIFIGRCCFCCFCCFCKWHCFYPHFKIYFTKAWGFISLKFHTHFYTM